jgi:hypothetical protein
MGNRNLSHQQLSMFMKPGEIKARGVSLGELNSNEDHDESESDVWDRKWHESFHWDSHGYKDPVNLNKDIKEKGVHTPVTLRPETGQLIDGYHRVSTAAEVRPHDLIPVEYE